MTFLVMCKMPSYVPAWYEIHNEHPFLHIITLRRRGSLTRKLRRNLVRGRQ